MKNTIITKCKFWFQKHNAFILSLIIINAVLLIYLFTSLGVNIIVPKYSFSKLNEFSWQYDISTLDEGFYYFSAGKTNSGCSLYFKDQLLSTNKSDMYRLSLLFGYPIKIDKYMHNDKLVFTCDFSFFYSGSLSHWPVILPYKIGIMFHWWRSFCGIFLAMAFCVWMLLTILSSLNILKVFSKNTKIAETTETTTSFNEPYFLIFAILSLMYAFSQSYYFSVFFEDNFCFLIDVTFHHLFVWSYLMLMSVFVKRRKIFDLILLISLCFSLYSYNFNPLLTVPLYLIQNILFISFSLILAKDIYITVKNHFKENLFMLTYVFLFSHILLFFNIRNNLNLYSNEVLIAILNLGFIYLRQKQIQFNLKLSSTVSKIIRAINSNNKVSDILNEVSTILINETNFLRVSSYIDAFLIGEEALPGKTFIRITDLGYRKPTILDKTIKFEEGRGLVMKKAISEKDIIFNRGKDQAYYLVIPVGNLACINLSDDEPRPERVAIESKNNILQLLPFLNPLQSKLEESMFLPKFGINIIKNKRGVGMWEIELGAIFIDVVNSSMMKKNLGSAFAKFLDYDFFPLLFNYVKNYSYPEFTRGDEVYFPVISDFLSSGLSVYEATIKCTSQIAYFLRAIAPELCMKKGYPPILLRVGVSAGPAILHSESQITTSGYTVDEAKRLQVRAAPGEILVSKKLIEKINTEGYHFGSARMFLIKSSEIIAYPFISGPYDKNINIYKEAS